jgi:hypothetical protein
MVANVLVHISKVSLSFLPRRHLAIIGEAMPLSATTGKALFRQLTGFVAKI